MNFLKHHILPAVALGAALAWMGASSDRASAAETMQELPDRFDAAYPYLIVDQSLGEALREFGRNLDMAIDVSRNVRGRVHRYEHDGSARAFLAHLAEEHRLDWVLDRGRLFISSAEEKIARSWPMQGSSLDKVSRALGNAGLDDARYPVALDPDQGYLNLSAPPQYMSLAAPVIERLLTPDVTRSVNVIYGRQRGGGT